ncbi:type II toxin-antitoxin system VapC family toxin [Scrofimicrobium canadense]|uniref:type II toxin-antitoxin system VapC family toxin n=1 Tax=Scrofimicrobium canadense TaxID=2652290 RepID=UPI001CEDEA90|nr:type II toxin-antitoxin system VapC family toxin [Scrofimicrobium canadense]
MYLLDTHTLLWALTEPSRLGKNAYRIIEDRNSVLYVSPASAWEIGTKQRLGKLPQADFLIAGYSDYLNQLGVQRLPITDHHAMVAGSMEWQHKDPFDRMLASQAILESLTLITCDSVFGTLRALKYVW